MTCQWIAGDPRKSRIPGADDMKCGRPADHPGCPWCAHHLTRAYKDGGRAARQAARRRAADFAGVRAEAGAA